MTHHAHRTVKAYVINDPKLFKLTDVADVLEEQRHIFADMIDEAASSDINIWLLMPDESLATVLTGVANVASSYIEAQANSGAKGADVTVRWHVPLRGTPVAGHHLDGECRIDYGSAQQHVNVYVYTREYFAVTSRAWQRLLGEDVMRLSVGIHVHDDNKVVLSDVFASGLHHLDTETDRQSRGTDYDEIVLFEQQQGRTHRSAFEVSKAVDNESRA
jgi:hypothetical protein